MQLKYKFSTWHNTNVCMYVGCPDILLENGIVTYSKSQTSPGHRPVRTVASLHCNVGYALLYDKDKMCLKSGMWSGDSSFCVGKYISSTAYCSVN